MRECWTIKVPAGLGGDHRGAARHLAGHDDLPVAERSAPRALAQKLRPLYLLSWHKWWFDELYDFVFVRPTLAIGAFVAVVLDRGLIDGIIHSLAAIGKGIAVIVSVVGDRFIIDNGVDTVAAKTWDLGLALRTVQTGRLRQYVMFIVVGTIVIFLIASVWRFAVAG